MAGVPDLAHEPYEPLSLLLFVDNRPLTGMQAQEITATLTALDVEQRFVLKILNVADEPQLVEYFKLVATPALVKNRPGPRQVLAGSDLVTQLHYWWPRWETLLHEQEAKSSTPYDRYPTVNRAPPNTTKQSFPPDTATGSSEVLRLKDEIFRLRHDKTDLEEQLRFQERILAMLAHDLRNPLTAAALAVDTLGLSISDPTLPVSVEMSEHLVRQARQKLREIDRMITDILKSAQGRSEEFFIQPRNLDLRPLLFEALDQLGDRLTAKSLLLQTDIPSDLPNVCADPNRVRQVLVNLLDNAVKYNPVEGSITLSVIHRTTQKIQVSICDTGPGIPAASRELIFNDRFRLPRDQDSEGYGIGLSVCKRIIQTHYGQIWVDGNHQDQGSCFHFTLPVYL
jgi:two-component system, OmpR family, clock-associated histidine kinase SasA